MITLLGKPNTPRIVLRSIRKVQPDRKTVAFGRDLATPGAEILESADQPRWPEEVHKSRRMVASHELVLAFPVLGPPAGTDSEY